MSARFIIRILAVCPALLRIGAARVSLQQNLVLAAGLMMFLWAAPVAAISFQADLTGSGVVPPASTTASGFATFELRDTPLGPALDYFLQIDGLDMDGNQTPDVNDNVTGVHMHVGSPNVNGLFIYGLQSPDNDLNNRFRDPVAGIYTGTWSDEDQVFGAQPLSSFVDELLAGGLYIQIHTVPFDVGDVPPAEIRGQITGVPEPSALGLAALALALAGIVSWRRR